MKRKKASGWLWLFLAAVIFAYVGWNLIPIIHCHYWGKETVAVVADTSTRMEGGVGMDSPHQVRYFTLAFDGRQVEKRTSGKHEVGERLPVIYLPDNSDSVVRGSRADGLWRTIQLSTNERNVAIALGVAVFLLFCAVKEFRDKRRRAN